MPIGMIVDIVINIPLIDLIIGIDQNIARVFHKKQIHRINQCDHCKGTKEHIFIISGVPDRCTHKRELMKKIHK